MGLVTRYLSDIAALLQVGFVHNALIVAALLGLISGVVSPLIIIRQMSFAIHDTSELTLMSTSAVLLLDVNVSNGAIIGSVLIAIVLAALSLRGRQGAVMDVVLSFGMGLSVLFIHPYPGRISTAFSLLTGQIIGLTDTSLWTMAIVTVIVVGSAAWKWRPLLFASVDPVMAAVSGVNVKTLSIYFATLTGLVAARGAQIVGSLLVIALIITPGAVAAFVTTSPVKAIILSAIFAEFATVGGIVLSPIPGIPVSVLVTTIAFVIYLFYCAIEAAQSRGATRNDIQAAKWSK